MQQTTSVYARIWRSRGFVVVLLVLCGTIIFSATREAIRGIETRYEIQKLEAQVGRLNTRNSQLRDLITLLNSSTVQEQQARLKLGVQAEGEKVVIFPGNTNTDIVLPDADTKHYIPIRNFQPNPKKWFHFFWDKVQ